MGNIHCARNVTLTALKAKCPEAAYLSNRAAEFFVCGLLLSGHLAVDPDIPSWLCHCLCLILLTLLAFPFAHLSFAFLPGPFLCSPLLGSHPTPHSSVLFVCPLLPLLTFHMYVFYFIIAVCLCVRLLLLLFVSSFSCGRLVFYSMSCVLTSLHTRSFVVM